MAFDIGAGLASLGEGASKFAGLAALEQQKSGLEAERLKLANDMAATRETNMANLKHSQDLETLGKTEAFTSGENVLNRANTLEAARISAGASAAAAGAHLEAVREQIASMEKQGEFHLAQDADGNYVGTMVNKKSGSSTTILDPATGQPMHYANPEAARAQSDLLRTTQTQYQETARLYATDLQSAKAQLDAAMHPGPEGLPDPKTIADAQTNLATVRQRWQPKLDQMDQTMRTLGATLSGKAKISTGAPAGAPSLDTFLPKPPAAPPAPALGNSLINGGGVIPGGT